MDIPRRVVLIHGSSNRLAASVNLTLALVSLLAYGFALSVDGAWGWGLLACSIVCHFARLTWLNDSSLPGIMFRLSPAASILLSRRVRAWLDVLYVMVVVAINGSLNG